MKDEEKTRNNSSKYLNAAKTTNNIISPVASIASLVNPIFLAIPVICSVCNELFSYFDNKSTEKRLKTLQDAINEKNVTIKEFEEKINELNEHGTYVVRNNVKHLCLTALPETVDVINQALIDYIVNKEYGMAEEALELIQQLNANDISFLAKLKSFRQNNIDKMKKQYSDALVNRKSKDGMFDIRNRNYELKTFMWNDLSPIKINEAEGVAPDFMLSYEFSDNDFDVKNYTDFKEYAFLAKSIIKLETLGIIQTEYTVTLGSTNSKNIDRIHLTLFGEKILQYIN